METRGHYIVVGAFVITILFGVMVAVIWLTHAQFQREGKIYDIYFSGPVSGLREGAAVEYNGVPAGRVSSQ